MRLDCVNNSVLITININKVLSALFLPLRLSLPNIYKYRTVPRRRRNSKGWAGKERGQRREGSEENGKGRKEDQKRGWQRCWKQGRGKERATQSGQYHRLQKALASCVQAGGSCVCSVWTGGWRWRRRSTGTLAQETRG